jgi:flavin-dependent dehydrogenase
MPRTPEATADAPAGNPEVGDDAWTADVLVAGGGPAGSVTALALARAGRSVLLLEKGRHPRFHIGESLLPMSMPLLEQLGLRERAERIGLVKLGADFPTDGKGGFNVFRFRRSLNATFPHGLQVRRAEFDQLLFAAAREAGVLAREQVEVRDVQFDAQGVLAAAVDSEGREHRCRARYFVDATGRDTLLGNRLRLKRRDRGHQSAALFAHFEGVRRRDGEDAGNISIYRTADGWIWVIPLPGEATSIGLVCGPDTLRARGAATGAEGAEDGARFLVEQLRAVPGLAERMQDARLAGHLQATGNYSYSCRRYGGPGWLMVGDSLGFLDPVFSAGVHMALVTAVDAAGLVHEVLDNRARERALQAAYESRHRAAMRRISWFIRRFNAPVMRRLFSAPRNDWRVEEAMIAMLAGDLHRDGGIAWRLRVFKIIYGLHALRYPGLAVAGLRQRWRRVRERWLPDGQRA